MSSQPIGIIGADPDQLSHLGATLQRQHDIIEGVLTTVNAALDGTTWTGPARRAFETDWHGSFRTALQKLAEAMAISGRECRARSDELRRVMGAG
ncbi:MAG: hypothetical protein EBX99_01825 [Acidimicrobiia bacterium]|jgi:hypothetical protein|nr:hypothetical protein [Actinomycetota bacterium]NDE58623.1 hypothetical protein [Acidimicrobiia bacterium]NDH46589.1 hypothetical protein [Acidimicrobiia bacterium]